MSPAAIAFPSERKRTLRPSLLAKGCALRGQGSLRREQDLQGNWQSRAAVFANTMLKTGHNARMSALPLISGHGDCRQQAFGEDAIDQRADRNLQHHGGERSGRQDQSDVEVASSSARSDKRQRTGPSRSGCQRERTRTSRAHARSDVRAGA